MNFVDNLESKSYACIWVEEKFSGKAVINYTKGIDDHAYHF